MISFLPIYFLVILFHSTYSMIMPGTSSNENPCDICRKISEKFIEAYKKTEGSGFGGGNTDWEEKKLKGYAKSEIRLIEIIENSCTKTESQCNSFLEKYEDDIEHWYQISSLKNLDNFYQWLCIDTANVCCPKGTFGKNCRRCQYGDNGRICSGNGDCDGDGTRSGNGRCDCHLKYKGTNCSNCQNGYIKSIDENKQIICTDIDECKGNIFFSPCYLYQCQNTDGNYECYGTPFYLQISKMSTLAILLFIAICFIYKEMYNLASLTLIIASISLILFARSIL